MSSISDIDDDLWPFQEAVTALLMGNPTTRVVPFTAYRKLLIESVQDEALAAWKVRVPGKVGIACLVMMPSLRIVSPEVPGPQYEIVVTIRALCDPRANNTGLTAEGVGMANLRWLDGHLFTGITELHGDSKGEALKPCYDYPGLLAYDSVVSGPLPQDYLGRCGAPTIAADGAGMVTLSGVAAGTAVYYTVDGTEPMPPANAGEATSARVYQGAFLAGDGATIKALAWNQVNLPSHTAQAVVRTGS
jgi:hypothetical protein